MVEVIKADTINDITAYKGIESSILFTIEIDSIDIISNTSIIDYLEIMELMQYKRMTCFSTAVSCMFREDRILNIILSIVKVLNIEYNLTLERMHYLIIYESLVAGEGLDNIYEYDYEHPIIIGMLVYKDLDTLLENIKHVKYGYFVQDDDLYIYDTIRCCEIKLT